MPSIEECAVHCATKGHSVFSYARGKEDGKFENILLGYAHTHISYQSTPIIFNFQDNSLEILWKVTLDIMEHDPRQEQCVASLVLRIQADGELVIVTLITLKVNGELSVWLAVWNQLNENEYCRTIHLMINDNSLNRLILRM